MEHTGRSSNDALWLCGDVGASQSTSFSSDSARSLRLDGEEVRSVWGMRSSTSMAARRSSRVMKRLIDPRPDEDEG